MYRKHGTYLPIRCRVLREPVSESKPPVRKALVRIETVDGESVVVALDDIALGKRLLPIYDPATGRRLDALGGPGRFLHRGNIAPRGSTFVGWSAH